MFLRMDSNPTTPLYSDIKRRENFFDEEDTIKNENIAKWSHAYKGYASTYVDIVNSLFPEIQLKNTGSVIKNKLKDLLCELRGFKIVMALVLADKKIETDDVSKYSIFKF